MRRVSEVMGHSHGECEPSPHGLATACYVDPIPTRYGHVYFTHLRLRQNPATKAISWELRWVLFEPED